MPQISVLMGYGENDPDAKAMLFAFTQRLRELGWTDGRNVRMDLRWAPLPWTANGVALDF
jgi:putative tryptophan/tyrosine transport system substrate-binding protein